MQLQQEVQQKDTWEPLDQLYNAFGFQLFGPSNKKWKDLRGPSREFYTDEKNIVRFVILN